jgi:hypothetical protein
MHLRLPMLSMVVGLAGCDFYPETGVDSGTAGSGACDTKVMVPTGGLQGDPVPAQTHAETYGADPTPFSVHLGAPNRDPSTSVSMLWRTDAETMASIVEYGPAETWPEGATRVEGYTFGFGGGELGTGPYRIHEVRLCETLTPATAYTYRVGGDGGWSTAHTFTTPGAPGSFDTYRVAIAGDSRGAYDTWAQMVTAMETHEPDLFLFSGDMVELGAVQSEWDAWFAASGDTFARKLVLPAHGNHEFLAQNYFAHFGVPGNEEWFAVEFGDMLVMSLNDTVRDAESIETLQPRFMEAELAATTSTWQVAMHHQPIYSTCTRHGSYEGLRALWEPVFDAGGVDLVFAGHNHIYERSVPITAGAEVSPDAGVQYVVTGGAGAPLYNESDADWFGLVANPIEHYIIADFAAGSVTLTVRDLAGNVIDEWSMTR